MGKRQDFINLARAGGSRQDFIDLAASFKVPLDPFKALTIYDMLMSGALPSELKHGGIASLAPRSGYARGGWSPGVGRDERGYQSSHPSYGGGGGDGATIETPVIDRSNINVSPITTYKEGTNYLDQVGLGINRNRAYALGLLRTGDLAEGEIDPDIYAGISGDNFNVSGQKTKDMTGVDASAMIGPVNVQGSYQDFDGNINKNIGASYTLGNNLQLGTNYDFEGNPTFGVNYNRGNLNIGGTYDGDPYIGARYSLKYNKGGLARILNL